MIYAGLELLMGFTSTGNIAHFAHLGGAATGFLLFRYGDKWGIYNFFAKFFKRRQSTVGGDYHTNVYKINFKQRFNDTHRDVSSANKPNTQNYGMTGNDKRFIVDGEEIMQAQIDSILDKISAGGYQNLSDKEKKILFELSKRLK